MRRMLVYLLIAVFVISGCGSSVDTAIPAPPQSTLLTKIDDPKINQIIEGWKSAARAEMLKQQVVSESIEERVYQSEASLQEIADFYKKLTEKGWFEAQNLPGVKDGILLTGYEADPNTLVIGAIDASKFEGDGVVVYTIQGHK